MKNYIIYTDPKGTETKLKLPASKALELEEKLGASIPDKTAELDKLSIASEYIAAALPDGEYRDRKKRALEIYDEMIESGKNLEDYEFLIMDMLVASGFMNGETVEKQKAMTEADRKVSLMMQEIALASAAQKLSQASSPLQSVQESATEISGE